MYIEEELADNCTCKLWRQYVTSNLVQKFNRVPLIFRCIILLLYPIRHAQSDCTKSRVQLSPIKKHSLLPKLGLADLIFIFPSIILL